MGKTNFEYTNLEIETNVKKWSDGGAYVSVPNDWAGRRVKVILLQDKLTERENDAE
jgi:putative transposon-encoded protein